MNAIAFDTETTGFLKNPPHGPADPFQPDNPRIICAGYAGSEKGSVVNWTSVHFCRLDDRAEWNPHAEKIHGITEAEARACGCPENKGLADLERFLDENVLIVGHNVVFDLQQAFQAHRRHMGPEAKTWRQWAGRARFFDTMSLSKELFGTKKQLGHTYKDLLGVEMKVKHDAGYDAGAALEVYQWCVKNKPRLAERLVKRAV